MNKSKMKIDPHGNKVWTNSQGLLHNEEGPAFILTNGSKFWCINDKYHRENGPAKMHNSYSGFHIGNIQIF